MNCDAVAVENSAGLVRKAVELGSPIRGGPTLGKKARFLWREGHDLVLDSFFHDSILGRDSAMNC